MFTDNPTIPAQLEVLLDVVYTMRQRKASAESLRQMIQPDKLPDLTPSSRQFANHLSAALELKLVKEDHNKDIRLAYNVRGEHEVKPVILGAFDRIALADARVEKWAGRFYAYLIVQDDDTIADTEKGEVLANRFMADLPSSVDQGNPMNKDKYRALERWYRYVGLGWTDPSGAFIPDPTERLRRVLPLIWQKDRSLEGVEFLDRLSRVCPELDGGALFREVTSGIYVPSHLQCTQALAAGLRRLHEERLLRLHCPADSKGWSLEKAGLSPVQGEASNRFNEVSMVTPGRGA